jgi:hypothetical protein
MWVLISLPDVLSVGRDLAVVPNRRCKRTVPLPSS